MASFVLFANILIGIFLIALYFYKKVFEYWKPRNVPYIQPELWHGNSRGLGQEYHTFKFIQSVYQKLKGQGPVGGVFVSLRPVAVINDLDLVKSVLVKDFRYFQNRGIYYNSKDDPISEHISNIEDDQWKQIRSKLTPTFTTGKLKMMFDTIKDISDKLLTTIEHESADLGCVEIKQILARFTCDVIGSIAFGVDCDSLNDKNAKFFEMAVKSMDSFDYIQRLVLMGYRNFARLLRIKLTPDDVSKFYMDVVKSIIDYRSNNKDVNRADLMNILINLMENENLSLEQVTAQSFFYFVAGYETSSTTLTFMLYEMSQCQELQEKARQEVLSVMEKHHGELTYEAISEMSFIEKIINETLRKWPPSVSVQRETTANYKIPNSKIVLEKGTAIIVPVYGFHHDPEIYPEPEKFDPSRFDDEEVKKRHPFAWLPFGSGPRGCPGIRFSLLEVQLCVAKILLNYQFSLDYDKTEFPIKISPSSFMMSPAKGVFVNFTKIH
jgi:cytochrome P450 family 6